MNKSEFEKNVELGEKMFIPTKKIFDLFGYERILEMASEELKKEALERELEEQQKFEMTKKYGSERHLI